jgi:hypothetical protein
MRATRRRSTPRDPGAGLLGIYGEIGDVAADGRLAKSGAVIHDRLSARHRCNNPITIVVWDACSAGSTGTTRCFPEIPS